MNADPTSLDSLHDIVVPGPVSWWPLAPGWWWLAALLVGISVACVLRWILRHQRNRYRREALADLGRCEPLLGDPSHRVIGIATIALTLKRVALSAWPREQVANLTGTPWLTFLDRTNGAKAGTFASGPGRWLETAAFDPKNAGSVSDTEARELAALARNWVVHHRPEAPSC